jgi:hypothetical protein
MKNKIIYSLIFVFSIGLSTINAQTKESNSFQYLEMGSGYSNDIYYSVTDGEILNIPRAGWDIAFFTAATSAGIIINEGSGAMLWTFPDGDISDWNSVDTSGILSWDIMFNSPESWEVGAFNRNSLGYPDCGWGLYDEDITTYEGDSIYIIQMATGAFKKICIIDKNTDDNTYNIKYADLDGYDEHIVEINANPYITKNFVYYSLGTNTLFDREPSADWDILFTKYIDITYDQYGDPYEYLVTGATSNVGREANKYHPVPDDYVDFGAQPFETLKNVIGYNWKIFDLGSMSWECADSTVFFVRNTDWHVYRIRFTYWQGSSSGYFEFYNDAIDVTGIENELDTQNTLSVYPNPATETVNVKINNELLSEVEISITDLSGRTVYNSAINNLNSDKTVSITTSDFVTGVYFISLIGDDIRETQKLVIK